MDDEEEFDDIKLDPIALTAIAGGQRVLSTWKLTDDNPQRLQSSSALQFLLRRRKSFVHCSPQTLMLHDSGWWSWLPRRA